MFASLYLPNFLLQSAVRHLPELRQQPVAIVDDETAKGTILEINENAEREGVAPGMAPSQALARCLRLVIKTRDRRQENALAEVALQFAFTLSPDVEATATGVWTIQFTDIRDIESKTRRVIDALAAIDITARAGIAPTPDASLLAAHATASVLKIDDARAFLATLPLDVLATV